MKYSNAHPPLQCMLTQSTCFQNTSKMFIKGVLWHSTGANNPWLRRYIQPSDNAEDKDNLLKLLGKNVNNNDYNHIEVRAGLNAWIGRLADGTVAAVQTMPWIYKPWGCGAGFRGSCNDGWIQFEICEDNLQDERYFRNIYQEACELTAYLCNLYGIDPYATVEVGGIKVPTILCHKDSYKLGLGTNHGDVMHWFPKYDKTMADARNDVADLLHSATSQVLTQPSNVLYRVRKSWTNSATQIGAYSDLDNAKAAADRNPGYKVYDDKGQCIYPIVTVEQTPATETRMMTYYHTLEDVPEAYRPSVKKVVDAKALKGTGNGTLDVSDDMCRIFTVLDRLGRL